MNTHVSQEGINWKTCENDKKPSGPIKTGNLLSRLLSDSIVGFPETM
jgi:hypothetical protein